MAKKKANTKVLVAFVQDRSGSMASVWEETLSGYKAYVKDMQTKGPVEGVDYLFTLTVFDTSVDHPYTTISANDVSLDELAKHGPRGGTALYDAVGSTIRKIEADRGGADKVLVVIVTDGHENSSREWTKDGLKAAITEKIGQGDWTFTYLGTQPETWDAASGIGISVGNTINYVGANAASTYTAMAAGRSSLAISSLRATSVFTSSIPQSMVDKSEMKVSPPAPTSTQPVQSTQPAKPDNGVWR